MSVNDFNTPDEILIKIKGRSSDAAAKKKKKRGPVIPSKPNDGILKRRRRGGFINFYDLGMVKDGATFVDIAFSVTPTCADPVENPRFFSEMSPTDWTALRTLIFTHAPATWTTNYKKLTYTEAERYGLDLAHSTTPDDPAFDVLYPAARDGSRFNYNYQLVSGGAWKEGGLSIPGPLAQFSLVSNGVFMPWYGIGIEGNPSVGAKVTATPNYADAAVPFTLATTADVFLMPRIVPVGGGGSGGFLGEDNVLMANRYEPYKRSFWLSRNYEDSGFPLLSRPDIGTGTYSAADAAALLAYIKARGRNFFKDPGDPVYTENAGSNFPTYEFWALKFGSNFAPGNEPFLLYPPAGTFLGAIRQAGAFYYFWQTGAGASSEQLPDQRLIYSEGF